MAALKKVERGEVLTFDQIEYAVRMKPKLLRRKAEHQAMNGVKTICHEFEPSQIFFHYQDRILTFHIQLDPTSFIVALTKCILLKGEVFKDFSSLATNVE